MALNSWSNIGRAFTNKQYRTYQLGRIVFLSATWMYRVAIGWLIWDLTHSATWLGVFGLLDQAPAIFVMPLAGAQADRMDSLKLMRLTQAALLVQSIVLALLIELDLLTLLVLSIFTVVYGITNAIQQPASQAILPHLVQRGHLPTAYGLNSLMFNLSRFIGPMFAGPMIDAWGTAPVILCNALGALWFMGCLTVMRNAVTIPIRKSDKSRHMLDEVREGFTYAMRHPGIGPAMVILTLLGFLPFTIDLLLPSLADGVYGEGAYGLSVMTSAAGLGAMCQALTIARRGGVTGLTSYVVMAILVGALAYLVLAFSGWFWLGAACVFVISFTASSVRVGSMTLLQYSVDPDMRGRVASLYGMVNHSVPALGALLIGAGGDRFGIPLMMGVIGVLTLAIWAGAASKRAVMAAALEVDTQGAQAAANTKERGAD